MAYWVEEVVLYFHVYIAMVIDSFGGGQPRPVKINLTKPFYDTSPMSRSSALMELFGYSLEDLGI